MLRESVKSLRQQVCRLSDKLQQAKSRESELGAELREQFHINTQLKQVGAILFSKITLYHFIISFTTHPT